ncbi:hypothetical protein Tco_1043548, partial [Tanacetum coccineum]
MPWWQSHQFRAKGTAKIDKIEGSRLLWAVLLSQQTQASVIKEEEDRRNALLQALVLSSFKLVLHHLRNKVQFSDYCLNPLYAIKECSSCGSLYTKDCGCSEGSLEDKILVPKPLRNCARCAKCGTPVDGSYCRGCALLRKKFKEDLFAYCVENFQDFEDTSESSDDNTNVVNAPQEPCVINQDPGENSSPSPPHIDHCCHECGDSLDGIFCRQCTCKSCGKGAHYGYNCPPKVPIISNPEPCNTQTIDEPLQNLQSLQQQCLLGTCQKCGCNEYNGVCFYCTIGNGTQINVSILYSSNDSPSFANHPPQNFQNFQQQYLCCENCGGPHETFQCQPMNEDYYHEQNSCYDSNSFGFDQFQPPQYTVNHPIFNSQNDLLNSQNKLMEQMTTLRDLVGQVIQKKEEEKRIAEEQAAKDRYWKIPICYDDDEDNTTAITPVLPIEEPDNSLSMGDEHLDTIPATESDEVIKSSVEDLVPIPSESEGIPDKICDVPLCENTTPLNALNEHSEEFFYDILREKLLNVNLLIAKIDSLRDIPLPPIPSSDVVTRDHEEFADELAHIISPPEYDHFCFKIEPELGNLTMDVVNDIFPTREPRVHVPNVFPTLDTDFILLSEPLFAYIVWIFLPFLTYPVVPPYLLSTGNEDTIFDPGISIYHSFMPDVSHRSGTFMKFNDFPDCEDSRACSIHKSFTSSASFWES